MTFELAGHLRKPNLEAPHPQWGALPAARLATPADAAEAGRLLRQLGCVRWSGSEADMDRAVRSFLARGGATRVLVVDTGAPSATLAALALVHVLGDPAQDAAKVFVEDLVVDAAARGQGLGKVLMASVMELARAERATLVYARADPGDPGGARLFASHGLEPGGDELWQREAPLG